MSVFTSFKYCLPNLVRGRGVASCSTARAVIFVSESVTSRSFSMIAETVLHCAVSPLLWVFFFEHYCYPLFIFKKVWMHPKGFLLLGSARSWLSLLPAMGVKIDHSELAFWSRRSSKRDIYGTHLEGSHVGCNPLLFCPNLNYSSINKSCP